MDAAPACAIQAAVDGVWRQLPEGPAVTALRTLAAVLGNLLRCPDEARYRVLRKANVTLQERLRDCGSCFEVLRLCGFVETPLAYELCEGARLSQAEAASACIQRSLAKGPPTVDSAREEDTAAQHALVRGPPLSGGSALGEDTVAEHALAAGPPAEDCAPQEDTAAQHVRVHFGSRVLEITCGIHKEPFSYFQNRLAAETGVPVERQQLSKDGRALPKDDARANLVGVEAHWVLEDAAGTPESVAFGSHPVASDSASLEGSSIAAAPVAVMAEALPSSTSEQAFPTEEHATSEAALVPLGTSDGLRHVLPSARSFFIGCGSNADLAAAGEDVEARHCIVYASEGDDWHPGPIVEVEDLSKSGTFCNGRRLDPPLVRHVLSHGDVLSLGSASAGPGATFSVNLPRGAGGKREQSVPGFIRFTLHADLPEDVGVHVRGDPDVLGPRGCELLREAAGVPRFHSLALPLWSSPGAVVRYRYNAVGGEGQCLEGLGAERAAAAPQPGHVRLVADEVEQALVEGEPLPRSEVPMGEHCEAELAAWTGACPGRLAGRQKCFQLWHDGMVLPFFLYVPPGAPPDAAGWPLLLFLHGDRPRSPGDCPLPGVGQGALDSGPPSFFVNPEQHPFVAGSFVCLAPQCPPEYYWFKEGDWYSGRWSAKMEGAMRALLARVEEHVSLDPSRWYLTGNSMGGYGAWELARLLPHAFAAVAPVSGHFGERRHDDLARAVAGIPMRIYHGVDDNICLPWNVDLLQAALAREGSKAELLWVQLPPGREHDADIVAYHESDDLFRWFLQQRRGGAACSPEAAAGSPAAEGGMPRFYLCGCWSDWALEEMLPEPDGLLTGVAGVDKDRQAVFQIVKDKDWSQRYCPRVLTPEAYAPQQAAAYCMRDGKKLRACPAVVEGPGPVGHGCNWLIDAAGGRGQEEPLRGANARFKVCFDPRVPSVCWVPYFDKEDRAAIRRLADLGVTIAKATDAYISAGRSEQLASAAVSERLAS